jgi:hypothetical protein
MSYFGGMLHENVVYSSQTKDATEIIGGIFGGINKNHICFLFDKLVCYVIFCIPMCPPIATLCTVPAVNHPVGTVGLAKRV